MNRRVSRISVALLASTFALVGNLATGAVEIGWRWWPVLTWGIAALLLLTTIIVEVAQDRPTLVTAEPRPADRLHRPGRVFGAMPRPAWHFQDRAREQDKLRWAMGRQGRGALLALSGPRGAGKTQLAAAYARGCVTRGYDLVAWINAELGSTVGLALLGEHLGIGTVSDQTPERLAAGVRHWLEQNKTDRNLIVFDNVEDIDDLLRHLPAVTNTKILVTSNRQEFATTGGFKVIDIGMFDPAQGIQFLSEATGLPDHADARRLGIQMGWLPLALAQAAAHIRRNRLSYRQYLLALDSQDLNETLRRQPGNEHPGVLRATQLSVTGLARQDPSGDAAQLPNMLSLLSPDGVSRRLLFVGEVALRLTGGLQRSLDLLAAASLVTLGGEAEDEQKRDAVVVTVHRLTSRVVRHLASRPDAPHRLSTASDSVLRLLRLLTEQFPDTEVAHRRSELTEIIEHVLTVRDHLAAPEPSDEMLHLLFWAGSSLRESGDLSRAISVLQWCSERLGKGPRPNYELAIETLSHLAQSYEFSGRTAEAIHAYQRAEEMASRVLGADHPTTLTTRNNLAGGYETAHEFDKAITIYLEVISKQRRILGEEHLSTLESLHNLACIYESIGALDAAIQLFEEILPIIEKRFGIDHPNTLEARNNMAYTYSSAGRHDDALRIFENLVDERVRLLGHDHPGTLRTRHNLARAYELSGRRDLAIVGYEQVLADRRRVLGQDNPYTLRTETALARVRAASR